MNREQAIELLAKQFFYKGNSANWGNATDRVKNHCIAEIEFLISLRYPCPNPECRNGKVFIDDFDYTIGKYVKTLIICPICHGTGLSDLPVIAEVCPEQTLPENPYVHNYIYRDYADIVTATQQDMIVIRVDKDGRKVSFRKVYVD